MGTKDSDVVAQPESLPADTNKPYEPTERERAALQKQLARRRASLPRVKFKITQTARGECEMKIDHEHKGMGAALLQESFGTADWDVLDVLCVQLVNIANVGGQIDNSKFQRAMALAQGIEPQNEIEAMLATQMAAIHIATMDFAARVQRSTTAETSESYERSLSRLARTFTAQIEALKKHRNKGEQRVVVEHKHYHLAPGAQAVFGDVSAPGGGGVDQKIEDQSHVRSLSERQAVLSTIETLGLAVPGPGDDGQDGLQVSRGEGGGAKRAA